MAEETNTGNQVKPSSNTPAATAGVSPTGGYQVAPRAGDYTQNLGTPAPNNMAAPRERDLAAEEKSKQALLELGKTGDKNGLTEEFISQNPRLASEKININAYGVAYPVWGATDSSASAKAETDKIISEVGGGLDNIAAQKNKAMLDIQQPEYKLYTDYSQDIKASRAESKDLYERLMGNIKEDYRLRELEQKDENRIQMGSQSKALARMGTLNRSGSAMSYIQDVDRKNQEKINKLLMEKERVLIEATTAYQNQDWEKLQGLMKENTRVTDQYNQVQQWKFEDSLKTNDQIMEQQRFGWDAEGRAMEKLSTIIQNTDDISKVNKYQVAQLESEAGMPSGTFDSLFDYSKKQKTITEDTNFYNLLSKIPKGETIKLNGNYYTGIGTEGNNTQYKIESGGKAKIVTVDQNGKLLNTVEIPLNPGGPSNIDPKDVPMISGKIATAFPDGTVGRQCGEFVHNFIPNYPYGLNSYQSKVSLISPNIGLGKDQYPPQVGDVVIQDEESYYTDDNGNQVKAGHVSVINSYDPETGIMTLTESNYYGDETVSNSRTLNVNDPKVSGFFRGTLAPEIQTGAATQNINRDEEDTEPLPFDRNLEVSYRQELENTKGDDGYVNTDSYTDLYNDLVKIYGQKEGQNIILTYFNPENFLNPNDPTAKFYFDLVEKQ